MKKSKINLVIGIISNLAYRRGFRPKSGSILHSPSAHLYYSMQDYMKKDIAMVMKAFTRKRK